MNNFYIRRISSLCVLIIEAITALTAFAAPPDSAAYAFGSDYSGHRKESLNLGWKFIRENIAGAESPDFSDRTWTTVNLPHDAAIAGSFSRGNALAQNGFLERGAGWYRRHLPYRSQWEGQRVILEFEGVYRCARVYVNGRLCGPTAVSNGYMPFEYDVTDLLREGDNLIAVSYDNTGAPTSRWYNGEGIDRNVWLTIIPPVHVDLYGTRITTPVAEKHRAVASVETTVVNTLPDSAFCSLTTRIFDPDGLKAGEHTACAPLAPHETYIFRQNFEIADPQLWDAGCGRLYRAESFVGSTGQQDDIYTTPFGIRRIELLADSGLIINGRREYLHGVCLHSELGPLGCASFDAAWERRLRTVVDSLGCNALRLSHNVYPQFVLDWCDRHGILVYDEMLDKWGNSFYGPGDAFSPEKAPEVTSDLLRWIRRDRNHPSVFIWGAGNEVDEQIDASREPEAGVERLKFITSLIRQADPTRPSAVGQYPARQGSKTPFNSKDFTSTEPHPFSFHSDVVATNYTEYMWGRDHARYPQLIFMASELAVGDSGYDYFNFDHSYPIGHFYWGGTDYLGESVAWPMKGWILGLIDTDNRMKPAGYSVRSFTSAEPMVKMAVVAARLEGGIVWNDLKLPGKYMERGWNYATGDTLRVQVMSNCPETELFLNGRSLGRRSLPPAGQPPRLTWEVAYEPGEILAAGYAGGCETARDSMHTALQPYAIVAETDTAVIAANGMDLAYIRFRITDRNGHTVPDKDMKLQFHVDGPATIQAVSNANLLSDESFVGNSRTTFRGEAMLILRSTADAGKITVKATAKGVKSATAGIVSVPAVPSLSKF